MIHHTWWADDVSPDLRGLEEEEEDAKEPDYDGLHRHPVELGVFVANLKYNNWNWCLNTNIDWGLDHILFLYKVSVLLSKLCPWKLSLDGYLR